MSTDQMDQDEMGTKPLPEHEWLQNLVGEWTTETEYSMGPDEPMENSMGTESVKSLGGLWAMGEGKGTMPGGDEMVSYYALGYDVTLKGYRNCWFASMSSHLWKYDCELSENGKQMVMNCKGPSFTKDGEMSNYRDVIDLIDDNYRTLTSYSEDDNGEWNQMMKMHVRRK